MSYKLIVTSFLWINTALSFAVNTCSWADDTYRLTILHTNGLSGQLQPGIYFDEVERGGFARLLQVLQSQTTPGRTLILDGGDALGDSPLARFDRGHLVAELMQWTNYDAMVPGNHEFDYGLDTLKARIDEMDFPVLAANVKLDKDEENPFQKMVLIERAGIKIALLGLLAPNAKKVINPYTNPGVHIDDVYKTLENLAPQLRLEADYIIALIHMESDQAVKLARDFPDVKLFIAGGFKPGKHKEAMPHRIELANGVRILTTPGRSTFVGRIDIDFRKTATGLVEQSFSARLLPVDKSTAPDPAVLARIDQLAAASAQASRTPIGYIPDDVENTPLFIAHILRSTMGAEVGVLNMGSLYPIALKDSVSHGDVQRLIRFDNALVTLDATGGELQKIYTRSKGRDQYGQQLIFIGYDPTENKINGRKLNKDEVYRVATTDFLAEGGDDYFTPRQQVYQKRTGVSLEQAVVEYISRPPDLDPKPGYKIWKTHSKVSGSLAWTGINDRASQYGDVTFLSGRSALAWNALIDTRISYETATNSLVHLVKSSFGQVRTQGNLEEAADRLQLDAIYTRETLSPAPFISLALNTVWTAPESIERPLSLRGSAGFHKIFNPQAKTRLGLGVERDFATGENELGLEVIPDYQVKFNKNNSFNSNMKLFLGMTEARVVSLQNYNTLVFRLRGNLYTTLNANFFLHRNNQVRDVGIRSELQAGLGYNWDNKWFKRKD